jgi:hypothetical protein
MWQGQLTEHLRRHSSLVVAGGGWEWSDGLRTRPLGTSASGSASFFVSPTAHPYCTSVIHAKIGMDAKFAPNSQELRELIQGPGDVEWRCVSKTPLLSHRSRTGWAVKHRYDMRHQCQEILPGLLLGPFQVSKNLASLQELGVSHMYASCLPAVARRPELLFPWTMPPTESAFVTSRKLSQFALVSPVPSTTSSSMYKTQRSRT